MQPTIPERHAPERRPVRPDRTEGLQKRFKNGRSGESAIGRRAGRENIEQPARPRRIGAGKQIRSGQHSIAQSIQQRGAPGSPLQAIPVGRLKRRVHSRSVHTTKRRRVSPQWVARIVRQTTTLKPTKTRQRETLGTHGSQPRSDIAVTPLRARPRIEQHGCDSEIERRASDPSRIRTRRSVGPRPIRADDPTNTAGRAGSTRNLRPQIPSPKHKMPPPCMKRRPQRRIPIPHDLRDKIRRQRQPVHVDRPIIQRGIQRQIEHPPRGLSHRRRRKQRPRATFRRALPRRAAPRGPAPQRAPGAALNSP